MEGCRAPCVQARAAMLTLAAVAAVARSAGARAARFLSSIGATR